VVAVVHKLAPADGGHPHDPHAARERPAEAAAAPDAVPALEPLAHPATARREQVNTVETKTAALSLTSVSVDGGSFTGYAAVFGNRDAGNDRIISGAFASSLGEYRKSAHIFWHHDTSKPIARVTDAREDDYGLRVEGAFYTSATAQEARTVLLERLAAGLDLGMSIGYAILPGGSRIAKYGTRDLDTRVRIACGLELVAQTAQRGALVRRDCERHEPSPYRALKMP